MKDKETLFDKAIQNYNVAQTLYDNLCNDEAYLNYVGYHLQQSVELLIKHELEENGIEYSKTHEIPLLIKTLNDKGIPHCITEYIDEHSEMLTSWESKTRYIKNYTLERRKIDKALVEIRNQLEIYMEITEQEHNEDYSFEDNHMEPENH